MIANEKSGWVSTTRAILKNNDSYVLIHSLVNNKYLLIGLKGERRNIAFVEENLKIVPFLVITMKVLLSA